MIGNCQQLGHVRDYELGYSETPSAARLLIGTKALGLCGR